MVGDRNARAKYLEVTKQMGKVDMFTVKNETSESVYQVKAGVDHLECECKDFQYLSEDFGTQKVACKHVFAVLGHLNFDSLKDYIKYNEEYYEERRDYNLMAHA